MKLQGRKIYQGQVEGEVLVTKMGISFFGGVDPNTGIVVEKGHELEGQSIAGKVLAFLQEKGGGPSLSFIPPSLPPSQPHLARLVGR